MSLDASQSDPVPTPELNEGYWEFPASEESDLTYYLRSM